MSGKKQVHNQYFFKWTNDYQPDQENEVSKNNIAGRVKWENMAHVYKDYITFMFIKILQIHLRMKNYLVNKESL